MTELLAERFPALAKRVNEVLDKVFSTLESALDTITTALKNTVTSIANTATAAINAAITVYVAALDVALATMKGGLTGDFSDLGNTILDSVLRIAGISREEFQSIFGDTRAVIDQIIDDPGSFVNNLIQAAKGGFEQFGENFPSHFESGMIEWLTGTSKVQPPSSWDAKGVFSFTAEVMGWNKAYVDQKMRS